MCIVLVHASPLQAYTGICILERRRNYQSSKTRHGLVNMKVTADTDAMKISMTVRFIMGSITFINVG